MPRGKYDRRESKIRRLEEQLEEANGTSRSLREKLERAEMEVRATKKIAEVASKGTAPVGTMVKEKSAELRDSLISLTNARKILGETSGVDPSLLKIVDHEISAHMWALSTIRTETYGAAPEKEAPKTTSVPMPARSMFQSAVPPQFPTAVPARRVG